MDGVLIGLSISTAAAPGADPVAAASRAEALGFDFVSASDHLHGRQPTYEPWTMLSWIAAATSRIRVATRVLGVPYRPPAVLAKMAETFDRLSGGRLILGLGGGAVDQEFRAFGLPVRSPRDKVDGLEEAIRIARGLWSQPGFSFDGRLYRTDGADLEPKPDRHIPIWLGTYGNRALALTGRLADGWIPSLGYAPPERVVGMRERVLAAARAAGRDPGEITCAYNVGVRVDERAEARADSPGHPLGVPRTPPDSPGHPLGVPRTPPSAVVGSADAVAERLLGFLELGFTALSLIPLGPGEHEQAERLAREVLPALRAARGLGAEDGDLAAPT